MYNVYVCVQNIMLYIDAYAGHDIYVVHRHIYAVHLLSNNETIRWESNLPILQTATVWLMGKYEVD